MANVSFTKDFAITKRETVERLEKDILTAKPLVIDSEKVLTEFQEVIIRSMYWNKMGPLL